MENKEKSNGLFNIENLNIVLLSVIALIESLQVLIAIVSIYHFFPLHSKLTNNVFSSWARLVQPERETLFYQIFIAATICLQVSMILTFKKQLRKEEFFKGILRFFFVELILLGLILYTLFKMVVIGNLPLIRYSFYLFLGIAMVTKILWWPLDRLIQRLSRWFFFKEETKLFKRFFDYLVPIFILILIYVPDRAGVIARIFVSDSFNHWDAFVTSSGWAFLKKCTLGVDVFTQYGLGMPVVISILSSALGGYTYENILSIFIALTIVYIILNYFLMRIWFKDVLIATIGTLLILKFQIFNNGFADPIIWRYPSQTVIRYLFDVVFFILIFFHIQNERRRYLILAALCSGVAVFYVTDTGLYQLIAFYVYLILSFTQLTTTRKRLKLWLYLLCFISPIVGVMTLSWMVSGQHIFQTIFWLNILEFAKLAREGWGTIPIVRGLEDKNFIDFFMAISLCLTHLLTVIFIGSMICLRKISFKNILAVVVGIYGLGTFHYFVGRSTAGSFCVFCIPFILLICFWLSKGLMYLARDIQKMILLSLCGISLFSLVTTHAFIKYPNVFNFTRESFRQDKQTMEREFIASEDVDLIKGLTSSDEKVCLVANLETATLMKANRKPFFYYFPLIFSRSHTLFNDFGDTTLFTKDRFEKTIALLEREKPKYVFIEGKWLGQLPMFYYARYEVLTSLLKYLKTHYGYFASGKYLVALKRLD